MTHEIMNRDFTVLLILPIKFMDFKWRHLPFVDLISLFFFLFSFFVFLLLFLSYETLVKIK